MYDILLLCLYEKKLKMNRMSRKEIKGKAK